MTEPADTSSTTAGSARASRPRPTVALESIAVGLASILYLATVFRSSLDLPPTFELARGLWFEAAYLADTGFDYAKLVREEPGNDAGAARNYVYTIMPTLIASFMLASPTPTAAIVAFRVVTLLLAAATAAVVYSTARLWVSRAMAALMATWLLSTPVFLAQAGIPGFEIPLAFAVAVVIALIARGQHGLALLAVLFSLSVKLMALTVAIAYFVAQLWRPYSSANAPRWSKVVMPLIGTAIIVGPFVLSVFRPYAGHASAHNILSFWSLAVTCPDGLASCLLLCVMFASKLWLAARHSDPRTSPTNADSADTTSTIVFALAHIFLVAAIGRLFAFSPRYLASVAPSVVLLAAALLGGPTIAAIRLAAPLLLAAMVAVNVANQRGRWLPDVPLPGEGARSLVALHERSLEWVELLRGHAETIAATSRRFPDAVVVAPLGVGHALATPRLGFVDRPRAGFVMSYQSRFYRSLKPLDFDALSPLDDGSAGHDVLVFAWRTRDGAIASPIPFESGDEIISDEGDGGMVAFAKRWLPRLTSVGACSRWIKNPDWPGESPAVALRRRFRAMCAMRGESAALREASTFLATGLPTDIRFAGLKVFVESGAISDARKLLEQAASAGDSDGVEFLKGMLDLRVRGPDVALNRLNRVIGRLQNDPYALYHYARALYLTGRFAEVEPPLVQCTKLPQRPGDRRLFAAVRTLLGDLYWLAGDSIAATEQWQQAVGVGSPELLQRIRVHVEFHPLIERSKHEDRIGQIRSLAKQGFKPPAVWRRGSTTHQGEDRTGVP